MAIIEPTMNAAGKPANPTLDGSWFQILSERVKRKMIKCA